MFEDVLGAMARAGLVRLTSEVFEKDGRSIPYRKAGLLEDREDFEILMKEDVAPAPKAASEKRRRQRPRSAEKKEPPVPPMPASRRRCAIGGWRKRNGAAVPAFRIFSDKASSPGVHASRNCGAELLAIPGIGISIVEKYGAQLPGCCMRAALTSLGWGRRTTAPTWLLPLSVPAPAE